ncbi:hypothetical protein JTB14_027057 [Gonioctena quinquepunctata]|nr:hypothetical protein JTB14_027057 [Gonioctena quinquepunctata]
MVKIDMLLPQRLTENSSFKNMFLIYFWNVVGKWKTPKIAGSYSSLYNKGLPAEEARIKTDEAIKKESTSDKGLKRVRPEENTLDGQPKKKKQKEAAIPTKPSNWRRKGEHSAKELSRGPPNNRADGVRKGDNPG